MFSRMKGYITTNSSRPTSKKREQRTIMQIEQGSVVKGNVTGLTDFGAFVELEGGKTGMIHISEVSTSYVKDIREHLQLNQEVTAKVISISPEGKIALSIKKLNADNNGGDRPQRRPRPSGDRQGQQNRPHQQSSGQRRPPQQGRQVEAVNQETSGNQSFEDMMAKFKQISDEKMTDLKRSSDSKRSGGYSRRGGGRQ